MPNMEVYHNNLTSRQFLQRLVTQKAIIDQLTKLHKDEKAAVQAALQPGWKSEIQTPFGGKLGTISLSNPEAKLVITDMPVALAGFKHTDIVPEFLDLNADREEILEVLEEHAPHLVTYVPDSEALAEQQASHMRTYTKVGLLPDGWDVVPGAPRLTLRSNDASKELAQEILQDLGVPVLAKLRTEAITEEGN